VINRGKGARILSYVLNTIVGVVVLAGSFLATSYVLYYVDIWRQEDLAAAFKQVHPMSWQRSGRATYDISSNGMVTFDGPDFIFNEVPCGSHVSKIRFTIFVVQAASANMQLNFRSKEVGQIGQPIIQDIGGLVNKTAEIRADTRRGAGQVQAVIYSPENSRRVAIFKDPYIECKPIE
jgi:hypothetical protein